MALPVRVLVMFFVLQAVRGLENEYRRDGFMDRLSSGMKLATDFLGSESVAQKVAEFVVRAFQPPRPSSSSSSPYKKPPLDTFDQSSEESFPENHPSYETNENRPNFNVDEAANPLSPLKYLVRLFGLQPRQISAVAVNALVFVAQMISTFLSGNRRPSPSYRSEDPKEWILSKNSRKLQELINRAKNESLFDDIQGIIREQASDEDTGCIRLLVCKITPFVHKMQEAVFGKETENSGKSEKLRGAAIMYRHLPSEREINERSDICERRHTDCDLND